MKITKIEFLEHLMVASDELRMMYHEERDKGNRYVAKGYETQSWDMQLTIQENLVELSIGLFEEVEVCELKERVREEFGKNTIDYIIYCLRIIDGRKDIIVGEYEKRVEEGIKLEEEIREIQEMRGNKARFLTEFEGLTSAYMHEAFKDERELNQEEIDGLNNYIEKRHKTSIEEVIELNDKLLDEFLIDMIIR